MKPIYAAVTGFARRRASIANPSNPAPSSIKDEGSGAGTKSALPPALNTSNLPLAHDVKYPFEKVNDAGGGPEKSMAAHCSSAKELPD